MLFVAHGPGVQPLRRRTPRVATTTSAAAIRVPVAAPAQQVRSAAGGCPSPRGPIRTAPRVKSSWGAAAAAVRATSLPTATAVGPTAAAASAAAAGAANCGRGRGPALPAALQLPTATAPHCRVSAAPAGPSSRGAGALVRQQYSAGSGSERRCGCGYASGLHPPRRRLAWAAAVARTDGPAAAAAAATAAAPGAAAVAAAALGAAAHGQEAPAFPVKGPDGRRAGAGTAAAVSLQLTDASGGAAASAKPPRVQQRATGCGVSAAVQRSGWGRAMLDSGGPEAVGGMAAACSSSRRRTCSEAGLGGCDSGTMSGDGGGGAAAWPPAGERLEAVAERLRALPREDFPPVSARAAAVLVGLFEDSSGVVRVLLTQRSARLKSHRGEVCLPGGKRDEDDADDVATALREAHEELGLDPARVRVLCSLPPVLSKHHLSVTPVVALLPPDLVPRPNPHEVAAAFTVPLAVFLGQFTDPRVAADVPPSDTHVTSASPAAAAAAAAGAKAAGRRTRQRVNAADVAAAAPAAAEEGGQRPTPLSWRASSEGGGSSGAAAGGKEAGHGTTGHRIGEDVVYGGVEHVFRDIRWGEHQYRIHSFQYGEFDVWGLTATICIDAARLALGRGPLFQDRCPGGHHYSAFVWDGTALSVRQCASTAPAALLTGDGGTAPAALLTGDGGTAPAALLTGDGALTQVQGTDTAVQVVTVETAAAGVR